MAYVCVCARVCVRQFEFARMVSERKKRERERKGGTKERRQGTKGGKIYEMKGEGRKET